MITRLTFIIMLAFILLPISGGSSVKAQTSSGSSSGSILSGVSDLTGVNPNESSNWIASADEYNNNSSTKTFFLYNIGTGQFVNIGGYYGTHAAMSDTPQYFYIYNNTANGSISTSTTATKLNLRTRQSTALTTSTDPASSTDFMQYVSNDGLGANGVYFDRKYNNTNGQSGQGPYGWTIENANDASHADAYLLHTTVSNKELYLSAVPNGANGNTCEAIARDANNINQEWKFISLDEYYTLFLQSPASLSAPTDASFLLKDHDFSVNNRDVSNWHATDGTTYKLGTVYYYKTSTGASGYSYSRTYNNVPLGRYQYNYGRYYCASITSGSGSEFYQDITLDRGGWYIIRCNGFSNEGAQLFVVPTTATTTTSGTTTTTTYTETADQMVTSPLNSYSSSATDPMLQGGMDFASGQYQNQVMIYIAPKTNGETPGTNTYTLRFGIRIPSATSAKAATRATSSGQTIFDSFRMLYAESAGTPDLVLDEDNFDMNYLTETTDEYTNAVLHLKRSFTLNKWNTLILPVSLTYGQMKRTFGDDVKLARLNKLTPVSIVFATVEPSSDDATMLEAYVPYIIKPSKDPGTTPAESEELHKSSGSSTTAWDGAYQGQTVENGNITIGENHYVISMVTLDRTTLPTITSSSSTNTNTSAKMDEHWVSTTTDTGTGSNTSLNSSLICYGTLAKTYTNGARISGRPQLNGSFLVVGGDFYQVPNTADPGLKAFRCWFKPGQTTTAKEVTLYLDGVELARQNVSTDILSMDVDTENEAARNGVYSLTGQFMGKSLEGLRHGLYIVNGKKVVVK